MTFFSTICLTCNPDVGTVSPIRAYWILGIIFYIQSGSNVSDGKASPKQWQALLTKTVPFLELFPGKAIQIKPVFFCIGFQLGYLGSGIY